LCAIAHWGGGTQYAVQLEFDRDHSGVPDRLPQRSIARKAGDDTLELMTLKDTKENIP
jgi:hypothetical protein